MFEGKGSRNNMFLKRQPFLQSQCFQNACPRCPKKSLSQPPPLQNKKLSCSWDSHHFMLFILAWLTESKLKVKPTCPVKLMFPESFPATFLTQEPGTFQHAKVLNIRLPYHHISTHLFQNLFNKANVNSHEFPI